jgi:hypothetical protein
MNKKAGRFSEPFESGQMTAAIGIKGVLVRTARAIDDLVPTDRRQRCVATDVLVGRLPRTDRRGLPLKCCSPGLMRTATGS